MFFFNSYTINIQYLFYIRYRYLNYSSYYEYTFYVIGDKNMTNRLLRRIAADMSEDQIINGCSQMFCDTYYDEIKKTVADNVATRINNSSLAEASNMDLSQMIDEAIKACMSANLYKTIKQFCDQNGIPEYTDDNGTLMNKIEEDIFNK